MKVDAIFGRSIFSFKKITPMARAKMIEVSRKAVTNAMGA